MGPTHISVTKASSGSSNKLQRIQLLQGRLDAVDKITNGEIGIVHIANKSVVFGSSDGLVARYQIMGTTVIPSTLDILLT